MFYIIMLFILFGGLWLWAKNNSEKEYPLTPFDTTHHRENFIERIFSDYDDGPMWE